MVPHCREPKWDRFVVPSVEGQRGHHYTGLDHPGAAPGTEHGLEGCGCPVLGEHDLELTPMGPFTPNHPARAGGGGQYPIGTHHLDPGGHSRQFVDHHVLVALYMLVNFLHLEDKEKPWGDPSTSPVMPQIHLPGKLPQHGDAPSIAAP